MRNEYRLFWVYGNDSNAGLKVVQWPMVPEQNILKWRFKRSKK